MKKAFLLPPELFRQIEIVSRGSQDEVRVVLLAAFALLLHRTQEQAEVQIAAPSSAPAAPGRLWQIAFSNDLTVEKLLETIRTSLVSDESSASDEHGVFFSYSDRVNSDKDSVRGLWLDIRPHAKTLEGVFQCGKGPCSESDLELFASRYPVILEGILQGGEGLCSAIPLLRPAERQNLLEWNYSQVDYPRDACLHTLIEAQVERTPQAVAVSHQGSEITYRDLNAQANRIAHYLIRQGVGPGSLVGLYTDPIPTMLSAMLGILKTGAAYVCLDPAYPAERLKFIAEECDLSFLLTTRGLKSASPVAHKPTLLLDNGFLTDEPTTNPCLPLSPEAEAFIVYTSGSTGISKGVIHSHRNIISRFYSTWAFAPCEQGEVYSQTSPLSSIDLIDEIYPPLLRGYRVHMIDQATVRDPHLLVEALERGGVTRIVLVPSLLRAVLSLEISLAHILHSLKVVLIGGEPLTYALVDLFYKRLPHARLINFYGLTEGDGSYYPVPRHERISFAPPIGHPIANTRIYILDPRMEPVPIGMPGEIYIANEGMAKGYFKRPELDSLRFLSNPFSPASEPRLYKTADRGRFRPDGSIEYLGRMDRMVKIRGFRVELGEVEAAIQAHPEVRECLVLTRKSQDEPGEALTRVLRLVAYVVEKQPRSLTSQALRSYLRGQLPDYAVPSSVVILESFPLSPAGKTDLAALPEAEQVSRDREEAYVHPRDPLESELTHMWEHILEVSPIGIHDNFFDIGGDSLNAVDLFLQIEKDLHKDLPISVLMQAPTIAELASLIRQDSRSYSWSSLVPIQPHGSRPPLFCIHANGGVIVYKHFVPYLGPDQPIYGLQAKGLLGQKDAPHHTVEEMAAAYIREIRSVQPHGPYQLCGFSMGGVIAYEMACQLRAAGDGVSFVGLLDAHSPEHQNRIAMPDVVQSKLSKYRDGLSQNGLSQKLDYLRRRVRHRLKVIRSSLFGWMFVAFELPMPHSIRYEYVRKINEEAAINYIPRKYPGMVTLFRATIQPEGLAEERYLGWEGHADKIEVVDVVGSHSSIMQKPGLGELLHQIQPYLSKASSWSGRSRKPKAARPTSSSLFDTARSIKRLFDR